MSQKPPALPLYVRDFLQSKRVRRMTAAPVGYYILLLCEAWDSDPVGYLPEGFEPWKLARAASEAEFMANGGEWVLGCFARDPDNGRLYSPRLVEVRREQREYSGKQSVKGKKGADVRWHGHGQADSQPDGTVDGKADGQRDGRSMAETSPSSSSSVSSSFSPAIRSNGRRPRRATQEEIVIVRGLLEDLLGADQVDDSGPALVIWKARRGGPVVIDDICAQLRLIAGRRSSKIKKPLAWIISEIEKHFAPEERQVRSATASTVM